MLWGHRPRARLPGGTELSHNPYLGLLQLVAELHLSCSSMSSSHALPQPHGMQLDALKRDVSWAESHLELQTKISQKFTAVQARAWGWASLAAQPSLASAIFSSFTGNV